jgi:hypothetical protein
VLVFVVACFDPSDGAGEGGPSGETTGTSSGGPSSAEPSSDDATSPSSSEGPEGSSSAATDSSGEASGSTTRGLDTTAADTTGDSSTGETPPSHTVFLNFEGPTLAAGGVDDARTDQTSVDELDIDFQPYGDAGDQAMLLALVQTDFAAFDVLVTDERPAAGDYTMVVVSPTNPIGSGLLGISSGIDCGNANPNNISFAFFGTGSGRDLQLQANVISGQIGLTVGLERTIDMSQPDLMHQFVDETDREFLDLCIELRDPPVPVCLAEHEAICGAGSGRQNAFQELEAIFGPA